MAEKEKKEIEKVSHKNIQAALSAFQGEMEPIEKDGHVNFKTDAGRIIDFKYSTYGKEVEVINPVLGKHGLSFRHEIEDSKTIECVLMHETTVEKLEVVKEFEIKNSTEIKDQSTREYDIVVYNELRSGKLPISLTNKDMKEVGAQITYGKRYTLGLVLGLATEEDKDTELIDSARKNVEEFAFTQAKKAIESAEDEVALQTQTNFLEKELKLAKEMEAGTGKKAPSLGLKSAQYESLLKIARDKKKGAQANETPEAK